MDACSSAGASSSMDASSSTPPPPFAPATALAAVKKRKPLRPAASQADIYVTRERRRFNAQVRRARRLLLERNYPAIAIHGLGAAIPNAIKLAAAVHASLGAQTTMHTATDTVTLFDDVIPHDAGADVATQARQNSAVHITMALPPALRQQLFARPRREKRGGRQ